MINKPETGRKDKMDTRIRSLEIAVTIVVSLPKGC